MKSRSSWTHEVRGDFVLVIDQDVGLSVTNDAEAVIEDLGALGVLEGRRVLYRDTEGSWDELLHDGPRFVSFAVLRAESAEQAIERARERRHP